jgi:hypothetical protein
MDIKKLQAILLSKGIRINDDDPVFTLVALNEAVLEDMTINYQKVQSNIKFRPSNLSSRFSGNLTVFTFTAITALGTGIVIGSSQRYYMLIGLVGLLIGNMMGFLSTIYLRREENQQVAASVAMDERTNWTEDEFKRVAATTQLSSRTLAACHDVLVGGVSIGDAAARHNLITPQVSRGIKIIQS